MTEDDFRDLLERNQLVQELTEHAGWPLFIDRAVHTIAEKQKRVLSGRITEEEYRADTGWLEGAQYVLTVPERLNGEVELARTQIVEDKQ